ncbi:MAG: MmgE/PrpD family protein [Betaproteobacteria bacterium]|nr:MmgE/PrpD family protein [Betaproteobacteria bacterium]
MTIEHPTKAIAQCVCPITYAALGEDTVAVVKRLIADGVAVAIAGSAQEPPRILADHAAALGGAARATVWGFGFKTTAVQAAFVNAASMHVLDFEPMSNPPTHAVSPTVPVAFALAEARQSDGREIIAACAKGFEMQGRVLAAADPKRGALPFHTPGVIGVMGATVAAAHLMKLTPEQLTHAMGIATSRCGGLSANTGSMVKCTHCGNVAAAGLEAAALAARGFTANPDIFGAKSGYVDTFFRAGFDYDVLMQFGKPYRCVDPGMAIKFYPSKYPTHFAIAAALDARRRIPEAVRIRLVRLVTPEIHDANRPKPASGLEGKFSFQYVAAAALLDGEIGGKTFTDERRFRDDMVRLLDKITVIQDANIPKDTRRMHVTVEVTLNDDTVIARTCNKPPGTWGEPIPDELHRAKLNDFLALRLNDHKCAQVLDMLDHLERLATPDVVDLCALLACKHD